MLCVSLLPCDWDKIHEAEKQADLIELRVDGAEETALPPLLAQVSKPLILTLRSAAEGGSFCGSQKNYEERLLKLARLGADYLDVEANRAAQLLPLLRKRHPKLKLIISKHAFEQRPFRQELSELHRLPGDFYKLATFPQSALEGLRLLQDAATSPPNTLVLGMGEHGAASRILYKRLGRPWTYAALSQGTPSAPGQLAVSVLRTIYRAPQLDRQTELYGLFGNPIAQSPGYLFHNSFYQARGLNAVYLPWRVESEELHTCLDTALELGFSGLSITIPHKTTVFDWVEKTRIDAAEIGAINTLLLKNGQRYGTNTDADAAADAIEAQLGPLKRLKVCILGAGGAARALLYACMARGATVELRARRTEAAKELATQFQALSAQWDDALSPQLDLLINTTPSSCYLDSHSLPQGCALMDLNPQGALDQRLERYARRGHRLISGKDMFERQAEAQNKLWFPNLATFHSTK